jgi:hypothetical protein
MDIGEFNGNKQVLKLRDQDRKVAAARSQALVHVLYPATQIFDRACTLRTPFGDCPFSNSTNEVIVRRARRVSDIPYDAGPPTNLLTIWAPSIPLRWPAGIISRTCWPGKRGRSQRERMRNFL